ncbi:MAG: DUF3291 domain-containing protein [Woeseia sp.]
MGDAVAGIVRAYSRADRGRIRRVSVLCVCVTWRRRNIEWEPGRRIVADYHLAQLNIAKMRAPLDSRIMADFVADLDRINALAEGSPGFVWRLQTDDGNATAIRPFGEDFIVNISLWRDIESLQNFVYRTAHTEVMRRRKEWFERMSDAYAVLWWVKAGELPDEEIARKKLELIRKRGPGAEVFTFKQPQPPPS